MTPLFKKLNLGTCTTILVIDSPLEFEQPLSELEDVRILRRSTPRTRVEFAIGFAVTMAQLEKVSKQLVAASPDDAVVWMAYPKQTSRKYTCEFNRDCEFKEFGSHSFEPVRQVAIDDNWSALRFRRAEFIKSLTRNAAMTISSEGRRRTKKQQP